MRSPLMRARAAQLRKLESKSVWCHVRWQVHALQKLAQRFIVQGFAFVAHWIYGKSSRSLRPRLDPYGLMLAARITLPHFSVSSAISLPNWAGDPGSGVPPRSARRAFILGSSRAALTSLLSWSTISAGVAFGTPRPYQLLPS